MSTNYVALVMFSLCYFSFLTSLHKTNEFQETEGQYTDWLANDLFRWLVVCNLDGKDKRKELIKRIEMCHEIVVPEVDRYPRGHYEIVLTYLHVLFALASRIMAEKLMKMISMKLNST